MFQTVEGEMYNISVNDASEITAYANEFFSQKNHENDILSVGGLSDDLIYISRKDVENGSIDNDCYVRFSLNMFKDARKNRHLVNGGVVPVLNELNEPVCLLKISSTKGYIHKYEQINGEPDLRVFTLYDAVVLMDVTEYGFILLKDVLGKYNGRVICIGNDWPDFARLFPDMTNVEFIGNKENLPQELLTMRTMYLMEFTSIMDGHEERCKEGFFSYDEIMTLVYYFSIKKVFGNKNPDKKFFLVDPVFPMEGLMSICDKCQMPFSYAEANGYIPVIHLTQSNNSIYSDYEGDDIWGKFFDQPYGDIADEWNQSQNVWQFPAACITFSDRWLMRQIIECKDTQLLNTHYINSRIRKDIDEIRQDVLKNPDRTIGTLIRGTDYTISHLPGHTIMASPEQVMDKINELRASGNYDNVYLSTEDEDILKKMKTLCADELSYIDQKRFRINPGELLSDQKDDRENDGWLRGKEYLITLALLSECGGFVASGGCCGTSCVLNSGKNFKDKFVFNLGHY